MGAIPTTQARGEVLRRGDSGKVGHASPTQPTGLASRWDRGEEEGVRQLQGCGQGKGAAVFVLRRGAAGGAGLG